MDLGLIFLIALVGGLSTFGMIQTLLYFHDKENQNK